MHIGNLETVLMVWLTPCFAVQILPRVVVCQDGPHQDIAVQVAGLGLASADTTILARCHGHYLDVQVCSPTKCPKNTSPLPWATHLRAASSERSIDAMHCR